MSSQSRALLRGRLAVGLCRQILLAAVLSLFLFISDFVVAPVIGVKSLASTDISATVSWNNITLSLDPGYDSYLASSSDTTANNLTRSGTGSSVYNTGTWAPVQPLASTEQVYKNETSNVSGFSPITSKWEPSSVASSEIKPLPTFFPHATIDLQLLV